MAKTENQSSLFGDQDQVFNALETELTIVREDIDSCHNRIGKIEKTIEILSEREEKLQEARDIVAKTRPQKTQSDRPGVCPQTVSS